MPSRKRGDKPRSNLTAFQQSRPDKFNQCPQCLNLKAKTAALCSICRTAQRARQRNPRPGYVKCPSCGKLKARASATCQSCRTSSARTAVSDSIFLVDGKPCRYIGLTQDQKVVVSEHRYKGLAAYPWHAQYHKRYDKYYAVRHTGDRKTKIYMHRQIIGGKSPHIDHKNGDTLDNRDDNLRPCTVAQNQQNKRARRDNPTGYKGVQWIGYLNARNPYLAHIKAHGKVIHLGCFPDAVSAAIAYNVAALKYFGEFARLNHIPENQ